MKVERSTGVPIAFDYNYLATTVDELLRKINPIFGVFLQILTEGQFNWFRERGYKMPEMDLVAQLNNILDFEKGT